MKKINKQNFINNLNNQYQQFLNKSENYLKLLVSCKKLIKGTKEFLIVKFLHDQILRFHYGKKQLYNVPASRILAKIINCSHTYILKVINKWSSNNYQLFNIHRSKINNKKYSVELSQISSLIHNAKKLNFSFLRMFLFKTTKYKELLNQKKRYDDQNIWS